MNRDWVLFNLREAEAELRRTIAELESTPDYGVGEFSVAMAHAYHHLNTAWNSQNASAAAVQECAKDDFDRWRQFPTDIYLGP
jgi:hypothetical protein